MFFIAYAFKGQVHVFAGRVKIVSHSSCRTSAILKYFCPLRMYQVKKHCPDHARIDHIGQQHCPDHTGMDQIAQHSPDYARM